jgi:hypothetical protein
VSWPDVGLTGLERFDADISRAFGRPRTPLWVTEYAESRPAVSSAEIAEDLGRAIGLAHRVPAVKMFIWFMLQNHHGEPWQSGLVGSAAFDSFRTSAAALDPRNGWVRWPRRRRPLVVRVPAPELRIRGETLQNVAVTYTLTGCDTEISRTGDIARMQRDASVPVTVQPGDIRPLRLVVRLRNTAGQTLARRYEVVMPTASSECS